VCVCARARARERVVSVCVRVYNQSRSLAWGGADVSYWGQNSDIIKCVYIRLFDKIKTKLDNILLLMLSYTMYKFRILGKNIIYLYIFILYDIS